MGTMRGRLTVTTLVVVLVAGSVAIAHAGEADAGPSFPDRVRSAAATLRQHAQAKSLSFRWLAFQPSKMNSSMGLGSMHPSHSASFLMAGPLPQRHSDDQSRL